MILLQQQQFPIVGLYLGTAIMLVCAIMVIISAITVNRFKVFSEKRDEHYMNRIEGLEIILRKEFSDLLKILKNQL